MTPFIIKASQPGYIDIAFFVDLVSYGAMFFHGDRAPPKPYAGFGGYQVFSIASPNRRADLRSLASVQHAPDLCDRLEDALAPAGWRFERIEQSAAARGRLGGRKRAIDAETLRRIKRDLMTDAPMVVARRYGVHHATMSNALRRDREGEPPCLKPL